MLTTIGDILNGLAIGVMFPMLMLPLAALADGKLKSALLWLALVVVAGVCAWLFARLAVGIEPPPISAQIIAGAVIGTGGVFVLTAATGAAAATAGVAPAIESLVRTVGRISLFFVVLMALIQFTAVVMRYVFGVNLIAVQESVTYMHGAVFLLAGGYALLTDDHVRVDIFYREASQRRRALVNLGGTYLFLFPFCLVALWAAAPYVANSWAVREGSVEQSGIPGVYLLKTLIPIYLTMLAFAGFVTATRAASVLRGRA